MVGGITPVYGTTKLRRDISVEQASVQRVSRGIASLLYDDRATGPDPVLDLPLESTGVQLSSDGIEVTQRQASISDQHKSNHKLAVAIRQRIETRLGKRITNLMVEVDGNKIALKGNCATYYSKQLAQHAALGVIEDENLANEITVAVPG